MDGKMDCDVVFNGEIVKGFSKADVKENLSKAFKLPHDKVEQLFSGKAVPLKKSTSLEKATALQQTLLRLGAVVHISKDSVRKNEMVKKSSQTLTLAPVESTERLKATSAGSFPDNNQSDIEEERAPFQFPRFSIFGIVILLTGITLIVLFSPYPYYVFRKGFAIGVVFALIGLKKIKSQG